MEADRDPAAATGDRPGLSMRERLSAMLERGVDAFGGWNARRFLRELQQVLDPAVSEVEGGRRAAAVAEEYARATPQQRRACWLLMSEHFSPDVSAIQAAHAAYQAARGSEDESRAEVRLRRAFTAPRTRLLQRFSAYPGGVRFLVDLRAELLPHLARDKRLIALDDELQELFSTWFDVGFLELRRISWDSPASLVEKLIRYEAVHDIRSWADAKNRLDEDRRCYGFFHPRLPDEPLIFVEVALLHDMARSITPLLDEQAPAADLTRAHTAIFYSISNTQAGLRGVSFGDSLIKRVVETLRTEFAQLKVFATLSPIPGLRRWVDQQAPALLRATPARLRQALERELGAPLAPDAAALLKALDGVATLDERSAARRWLLAVAARYLGRELADDGRPLDGVARFHLGNGARIEQLNWLADPSPKGLRQSWGLMVNYLYDLRRLDRHRAQLAQGKPPMSHAVQALQTDLL
ncbi:MAG TPA: malonyl-CoA decarboxylase [Ottowia sp.]|uniref:malonyl-CoA decarboxylase n=1 Tax=Ottowia sp. TaxID=1898956 RepID=UPI002C74E0BF|nr:malonyl-CoA decarboxylase [Ottowia sp.]MCZ2088017.1 malonyl-CoA decarboxylase [Burkholderiales bacterium]HNR83683.1 malonyl-CoA decarboxylase [Ottowia sp.]HNT85429.1 malonyl-CoA decarboxylase [Ottowia sp.]HOZ93485.1 malonyl-CoA decarboxylase [Ottowia sp.]HQO52502.1 malonyl-CoA decarboxylase [Ottowia sp.]